MSLWFDRTRKAWWIFPALMIPIFSAGCSWLASRPARAETAPEQDFRSAYLEAQLAMATERSGAAILLLEPLTKREDCPPEIFTALAESYVKAGNLDFGLRTLQAGLEKHPDYAAGFQTRASVNRRRGETLKAIDDLEVALKLEPNNAAILEELGLLRLRALKDWTPGGPEQESIDRIIDVYNRLLALRSGSERILPLLVLTSVYTRVGQLDKASELAQETVHIRPQDIRGHLALAETLEARGRREDALQAYRQALLIEPNNDAVRAKIADLIKSTNSPGGLLAFYRDLAESFPRVLEIQEVYGEELLKGEQWQNAADHYQKALKIWPENRKFKGSLVRVYYALGKQERAMEYARELIADPTVSDREMLELASMLRGAGQTEAVIDLLKRVAAAHPDEYRISLQLAGVQIEAGRVDDAIVTLESVIAKHPDAFAAVAMLGSLYTDRGRYEDAEALYAKAAPAIPKDRSRDLDLLKAQLYRQAQRVDDSIATLESIVSQEGEVPDLAVQLLIELHAGKGNFQRAHEIVDRFIARATDEAAKIQGKRLKAWTYWRAQDYSNSISILEELHAQKPEEFEIVRFLVENYADAGRYDQAQGLVEAAAGIVDERHAPDLSLLRARVFKGKGQVQEAIQVLESLMAKNQGDERYYLIAGEYYHEAGQDENAERVLRRAIEINPGNAESYNALGYFFAESAQKLDEAEKLIQKALELNPDAGHILDSLGWVYFQRGEFPKAVETLEDAIERMKDAPDPIVLEHLGDAYSKQGEAEKARETYQRALQINPKAETVKKKLGTE